jgi:signal transduction histidine kinase
VAVILAMAAVPLVAAITLGPYLQRAWTAQQYLGLHTIVETMATVAAFGAFAVQWYEAGSRRDDARARVIGSAFLAVALLESVHAIAFPGMPGLPGLGSSTERGIVYWLAARLIASCVLVLALAVPAASDAPLLRRGPLLALALGAVALLVVADYGWISRRPVFFIEGQGLTPLKKALEALVAVIACVGAALHARRLRDGDGDAGYLSIALGLTVYSELCFTLYGRAYDGFNLLGHLYLLAASYGVFRALFVRAVLRPYERLDAMHAELHRIRSHAESELAATVAMLQAVNEHREDLMRAVSHDLRTPLQVVLLQAERLGRTLHGEDERRARSTASAAQQMRAILQDLVESVQVDSGRLEVTRERVELPGLVADLMGVLEGALETDRVTLDIPPEVPAVAGDAARIRRVVQNLVGNALKYSPRGSPVRVRVVQAEAQVRVSVSDRGPGIAPEIVPRLFQRYYRGTKKGTADGLGLGLYISRLIVEAHGGRIWCDSTVGEGSTFSFSLPAYDGGSGMPVGLGGEAEPGFGRSQPVVGGG